MLTKCVGFRDSGVACWPVECTLHLHMQTCRPSKGILGVEVGFIFLVLLRGHQVYTLTYLRKEPYIHSPTTAIQTLLHLQLGCAVDRAGRLPVEACVLRNENAVELRVLIWATGDLLQQPGNHTKSKFRLPKPKTLPLKQKYRLSNPKNQHCTFTIFAARAKH